MHSLRAFLALAACAVLASCATTSQPSGPPTAMFAKLKAKGVSDATYAKIVNHRVLTYADIHGLLDDDVPSPVILTYLKSTKAPYKFTNAQLEELGDEGASAELINYLGKSTGYFEATERSQTGGAGKWKNDPFFYDPAYMGEPPFGYMWPAEWYDAGWMDGMF
jgi:hypothetical protein